MFHFAQRRYVPWGKWKLPNSSIGNIYTCIKMSLLKMRCLPPDHRGE